MSNGVIIFHKFKWEVWKGMEMKGRKSRNIVEESRKTAGLTQAEMAVRLQVCRQTYCRYERCPETMPWGIAARFAGVVGRSVIALFLAGISTGGG